jgi:hypothetical protein
MLHLPAEGRPLKGLLLDGEGALFGKGEGGQMVQGQTGGDSHGSPAQKTVVVEGLGPVPEDQIAGQLAQTALPLGTGPLIVAAQTPVGGIRECFQLVRPLEEERRPLWIQRLKMGQ